MRGMRLVAQRVQKKNVQAFELVERRLRNFAVIRKISGRSKAVAVNLRFTVNQAHRLEARAKKFHWSVYWTQLQLGQAAILVIGLKDVAEHLAQEGCRVRARVKRQPLRLVSETERAQIVDAQNVVRMSMCVEDGIHLGDALANGLRVKIGCGIDERHLARILDHH